MPSRRPGTQPQSPVAPVVEFANVRLLVRDFARSWRFYRETLGLTAGVGDAQGPYAEFLWDGEARLGLFDRGRMAGAVGRPGDPEPTRSVGSFALILSTPDVDAVYAHLRGKGIDFLTPPEDRPDWQIRTAHLLDPDGNLVEFYSELRR